MNQNILKVLQELRRIKPDAAYTKHSRMLILAAPQSPVMQPAVAPKLSTVFRLSAILGAGLIGIFLILGGISYINETYSPLALDGLNQKSLVAEANEINNSIEITLGSIDYLDTSNQATLKKIAEISKTNASTTAVTSATALSPAATSTTMDAFLIKNDAASTAAPANQQINDVLENISK